MKITATKTTYHKYALSFEYRADIVEFCRFLRGTYGWQEFSFDTNADKKHWVFSNPEIVALIKHKYPETLIEGTVSNDTEILQKKIEEDLIIAANAARIKQSFESNIEIKGLKQELYPYQKVGVEFFLNNKGRAILADAPGLGKTAQTLGFILKKGLQRSLVICPSSVKFSWEDEVKKWTKLEAFTIRGNTDITEIPHTANIIIINYDLLKKFFNYLMTTHFDLLAVDEFHMIKNNAAIRTKAVKHIARRISNVLLLSGTPLLSRPIELFNGLQLMDSVVWNNWYSYAQRYCGARQTRFGLDTRGATNIEELQKKIERYFLRRTKKEVLKELPPKNHIDIPVELAKETLADYKKVESNLVAYLRENKKKTTTEIVRAIQAEKLVKLNHMREITAMGKIEAAKEVIEGIIENEEKVLVFSSFNAPLNELKKHFGSKAVMIIGSTAEDARRAAVEAFQNDPDVSVFLGGFKSAGVGITLTAAQNVLFVDYSWNPADHLQAEDRAHRPGQTAESLNIYQLYSRGTIDGYMRKVLKHKQELFDKLIEKGATKQKDESIFDEIVDELQKEYSKELNG